MLADAIGGKGSDSTPEPRQGLRGAQARSRWRSSACKVKRRRSCARRRGKGFGSKAGRGRAQACAAPAARSRGQPAAHCRCDARAQKSPSVVRGTIPPPAAGLRRKRCNAQYRATVPSVASSTGRNRSAASTAVRPSSAPAPKAGAERPLSWGSCSGSASSSTSAKKLRTAMRTWSTGSERGERTISS